MQLIVKSKKGFTLVETLVAITVLLLVIIGPMTIAQKGIQNAQYASEQFAAVFLAQEALEAMRQLRDDVALDVYHGDTSVRTSDWIPDYCTSGCIYDPNGTQDQFSSCGGSTCAKLYIDSDTGAYSHDGASGPQSPFSRIVTLDTTQAATTGGVKVTVDVSWNGRVFNNTTRHVTLQTYIYDHYARYEN